MPENAVAVYPKLKNRLKTFYKTIDHEFGHALGLIDEYFDTASPEMRQKQVMNGAHPANYPTPGQHERDPWVTNQAEWAEALEVPVTIMPFSTSSIMNAGDQVFKFHYTTMFMVLCDLYKAVSNAPQTGDDLRTLCAETWRIENINTK